MEPRLVSYCSSVSWWKLGVLTDGGVVSLAVRDSGLEAADDIGSRRDGALLEEGGVVGNIADLNRSVNHIPSDLVGGRGSKGRGGQGEDGEESSLHLESLRVGIGSWEVVEMVVEVLKLLIAEDC
jgi:hypothetical protein